MIHTANASSEGGGDGDQGEIVEAMVIKMIQVRIQLMTKRGDNGDADSQSDSNGEPSDL